MLALGMSLLFVLAEKTIGSITLEARKVLWRPRESVSAAFDDVVMAITVVNKPEL